MATKYQLGDPVWAKMKGFSPWPAKIVEPTKEVKRPSVKKSMHCVFFFGTDNYAWVQEDLIYPYEEYKDQYMKSSKKSGSFKEAVEAINDYIEGGPKAKSGELPSIEEELASMFPIGSEKRRSKKQNTSTSSTTTTLRENSRLSQSSLSTRKADSPLPSNSPEPPQSDEGSITTETVVKPERKKIPKTKKTSNKRTLSDSSSTSSMTGTKKQRMEKQNEKLAALNSIGSPDEGTDGAAGSQSPEHGATGDGPADGAAASPSSSHNSVSVARRSASPTVVGSHYNSSSTPNKSSSGLLSRPTYVTRPVTPVLDVERVSEVLKQKKVVASELKFGFLGLGIMGQGIVKNLLNSGHQVIVWNRTPSKCREFVKAGATKGQTPADVVQAADITFCCVSDPLAAKEMVFGNCGVLQEIGNNKGYVEMTSIDPETSADIAEAIIARNGRYLEAPCSGSKKPAEEGMLIILAAGDRSLFTECTTCFQAMGKHAFYLGDVGNGSKMNLILNMLLGTTLASLAEAMALADRAGLSQRDLVEILELGDMNCPAIVDKGQDLPKVAQATFASEYYQQVLVSAAGLSLGQFAQKYQVTITVREREESKKKDGLTDKGLSDNRAYENKPSGSGINKNDRLCSSQSERNVVFRRSKRTVIRRQSRSEGDIETVDNVMSAIESVATRDIITESVNNKPRNVDILTETIDLVARDFNSVETTVTDKRNLNLVNDYGISMNATVEKSSRIQLLESTINSVVINNGPDDTSKMEAESDIGKKKKLQSNNGKKSKSKTGKDKDSSVVDVTPRAAVSDVSEPNVSNKVVDELKSKETGKGKAKGHTYTTLARRTQAILSDPEANQGESSNGEACPDQASLKRRVVITHAPVLNINSARNANNQVRTILLRQSFDKPEPPSVKRHAEVLMRQIEGHVTRRRLREELAKPTFLVKQRGSSNTGSNDLNSNREPVAKPHARFVLNEKQSGVAAAGPSNFNYPQNQGNTKTTGPNTLKNTTKTRSNPGRKSRNISQTPTLLQVEVTAPLNYNSLPVPECPTPRELVTIENRNASLASPTSPQTNEIPSQIRPAINGISVLRSQTDGALNPGTLQGQMRPPMPPARLRGQFIAPVRPNRLETPSPPSLSPISPRGPLPIILSHASNSLSPRNSLGPMSLFLSPNRFQGPVGAISPDSPSSMPLLLSPNISPSTSSTMPVSHGHNLLPGQIGTTATTVRMPIDFPDQNSVRVLKLFEVANTHSVAPESSLNKNKKNSKSKARGKNPLMVATSESENLDLMVAKPTRTYSRPTKSPTIEDSKAPGVSAPSATGQKAVNVGVPRASTIPISSQGDVNSTDNIRPVKLPPRAKKTAILSASIVLPPETKGPILSTDESSDSYEVMSRGSESDSEIEVIAEYNSSYFDTWEYGYKIPNPPVVVDLVSESDSEAVSEENSADVPSTSSTGAESLVIMDTFSLNNKVVGNKVPNDLNKLYYRAKFGGLKMPITDFLRVKGIELKEITVDLNQLSGRMDS